MAGINFINLSIDSERIRSSRCGRCGARPIRQSPGLFGSSTRTGQLLVKLIEKWPKFLLNLFTGLGRGGRGGGGSGFSRWIIFVGFLPILPIRRSLPSFDSLTINTTIFLALIKSILAQFQQWAENLVRFLGGSVGWLSSKRYPT